MMQQTATVATNQSMILSTRHALHDMQFYRDDAGGLRLKVGHKTYPTQAEWYFFVDSCTCRMRIHKQQQNHITFSLAGEKPILLVIPGE